MAFVPANNTVLAEVRMQMDGQKIENTLYFQQVAFDSDMAITLALGLIDWWTSFYAPLVAVEVQLREVVVTDLETDTGFQITQVPTTLTTGGITSSDALPNSVSLAVSFRTANRGRSFRGRNYIAGLTHSQVSDNTVDDTTVAAWQAAYTELLTVASDAGVNWVVVSRFHGVDPDTGDPIPRVEAVVTPVVTVVVVDNVVDGQRRRLPGRGK
jgi:hypothetical protein